MANILIVDDELSIQRMLGYVLRKAEHTAWVAGSAGEALKELHIHTVDLILLDVAMPDVDGIALLKDLRDMPPYAETPIIMLTASTNERDRAAAKEAGANAYVNKLANAEELLEVIDKVLAGD